MSKSASKTPALDPIDAAFVQHAAQLVDDRPCPQPAPARPDAAGSGTSLPAKWTKAMESVVHGQRTAGIDPASTLGRLLAVADGEWQRLADRVAEVHHAGSRVIVVAGGARGEGRTTVVDGLAATMRARGSTVMRLDAVPYARPAAADGDTIVLVDGGVWFPPGPIRVARVAALAQGCDAAILVRRADEPPCPARGDILSRIGIRCLGEVETFVP